MRLGSAKLRRAQDEDLTSRLRATGGAQSCPRLKLHVELPEVNLIFKGFASLSILSAEARIRLASRLLTCTCGTCKLNRRV